MRFGSRGADTTSADLAREMGTNRVRPWSWEAEGCWPGRDRLAAFLGKLSRVREEGIDPLALARWAEVGPDDEPPFDEPSGRSYNTFLPDGALRVIEGGPHSEIIKLSSALEPLAKSDAARAVVSSLLRAARKGERDETFRLIAALKPLAGPAAFAILELLQKELHSPAAGGVVGAESFSHLLKQHDDGLHVA